MDIMELGAIGELVGGVAVIVTLIYLALQVRHNTRVAESSVHYQMLSITNDHYTLTTSNPELSDLVRRSDGEPEDLASGEWDRFVDFAYMRFAIWEAAYVNHMRGLLTEEMWKGWDGALRSTATSTGYARFWHQERHGHGPSFQRYVDTEIFPPPGRNRL